MKRPETPPRPAESEPRKARRKRETHQRILDAAFALIAEKGVHAVTINEITERADVGFGSFYNHFASKEAVYDAVLDLVFEQFGDALDRLTRGLDDPAEIIAICIRHTLARAKREPLWGRFLAREGLQPQGLTRGLGARLRRDIQSGFDRGRFVVADPLMAMILTGGGVLAALSAELALSEGAAAAAESLGLDVKHLDVRATVAILRGLGVGEEDARRIVERPLPTLTAK